MTERGESTPAVGSLSTIIPWVFRGDLALRQLVGEDEQEKPHLLGHELVELKLSEISLTNFRHHWFWDHVVGAEVGPRSQVDCKSWSGPNYAQVLDVVIQRAPNPLTLSLSKGSP